MKNNVYVRSKKSIKNISLTRIVLLLPLIVFGVYKNGVYLYMNGYTNIIGLFKPIIFILSGAFIGALINLLFEKVIKRRKDKLINLLFSSFHIEYGILLGCLVSINTNIYVFLGVVFGMLFISKLFKNRINIMAVSYIIIYLIHMYTLGGYSFLNLYDTSRIFSLDFMDYMIGRGHGGIATTHIILLIISLIGINITNNNKSNISYSSIIALIILFSVYSVMSNIPIATLLLNNNYMFILVYVATDYVTSSYTLSGEIIFGILVSALTFGFYFLNPIIAPFIAITIVSLLNNLIDRLCNKFITNHQM